MGKKYLADDVNLDQAWLRRVRGKLTADEVLRAKRLADEDVKVWLRQLFGPESDDHETLDTIPVSDTDDTPLDVSALVIDDLFHKDVNGDLDRLGNADYVRMVDIAELIASHYLIQWGDFMGDAVDADGSAQQLAINNALRRMKLETERLASVKTTTNATGGAVRYYFQRVTVLNRSGIVSRRRERR